MIKLNTNEIHIWTLDLTLSPLCEQERISWLSKDERKRAERFRFLDNKQQFIAARSGLRQILSLYLPVSKEEITFTYNQYKKPSLLHPSQSHIQFNLAHSGFKAVYAITLDHEVGIDIEKINLVYNDAIAERFFSNQEKIDLSRLTPEERRTGFYQLWSRKEALLKAIGKGLAIPLSSFTVSLSQELEIISLENQTWSLLSFTTEKGYASALVSNQKITKLHFWRFIENEAKLDHIQVISQV